MRFGKQLSAERTKINLTAKALAEKCGVSRSYITLIENGKRLPSAKVLPKLAEALELKVNVVLNWYLEDIRDKMQNKL